MNKIINLKESDIKLLTYIFHKPREPLTKMSKATNLTREQVEYRIKNYISSGLIRRSFPLLDYSKFSYNYFVGILLKFDKHSSAQVFIKNQSSNNNCISYGFVYAKYDIYMNCIFKDETELNKYLTDMIDISNGKITDYFIIKPYFVELYPLKYFNYNEKDKYVFIESPSKERKLDKKELDILKILSIDYRIKIVEIAKKLNMSPELVVYKLKKLHKDKVIISSRVQFGMEKFGYYFTMLLLNIKNFSYYNQNKIKSFSRHYKHINNLIFTHSKPNCFIQVFHKDEKELRETINEIKNVFKEDLIDLEIMPIKEEEKEINVLPFI
ncbi:Lrp/AsnC family transcriptional regulator [Candidatus Woesearchaeota archaeon]|nr:Lrp/AsnC family transcriptional regulator [Candidatus Woesearchaeota archaeon]